MLIVLVSSKFVLIINLDLFPEKKNANLAFIQVSLSHVKLCYNRVHNFYFSGKKRFFVTNNILQELGENCFRRVPPLFWK